VDSYIEIDLSLLAKERINVTNKQGENDPQLTLPLYIDISVEMILRYELCYIDIFLIKVSNYLILFIFY
jgi:hypothetical protein